MKYFKIITMLVAIITTTALSVMAQTKGDGIIESGEDEIAEMQRAVQNPVANLISLPFQNNTTFKFGPQEEFLNVLNIQPVWPFGLSENWNLMRLLKRMLS